jgi:hypothetical protein
VETGRYGAKVQDSYKLGVKKAVAYGTFTGGIGALAYLAMITCVGSGWAAVLVGRIFTFTIYTNTQTTASCGTAAGSSLTVRT